MDFKRLNTIPLVLEGVFLRNYTLSCHFQLFCLLLLQLALQPLVGFGLLYDLVPQCSTFTLLSPISHFIFFKSSSTCSSHLSLGLPTGLHEHGSHSVSFLTVLIVSIPITCAAQRNSNSFVQNPTFQTHKM